MTLSGDEKVEVYLACRTIALADPEFLQGLTTKSARKRIRRRLQSRIWAFESLTSRMGLERLVETVHHLVAREILLSDSKARAAFPELFVEPSAEQSIRREASEVDAAEYAAQSLQAAMSDTDLAETAQDDFANRNDPQGALGCESKSPVNGSEMVLMQPLTRESLVSENTLKCHSSSLSPSLYPICVPYTTQHLILNEVQRLLEEACFDFAKSIDSPILAAKRWDCPSAGELTKWTRILARGKHQIPLSAFRDVADQAKLTRTALAVDKVRHGAVHRVRTTAHEIRNLCLAGAELAAALRDEPRAGQIRNIADELGAQWQGMRANKNALEGKAAAVLEEIRQRREELDSREKQILEYTVRCDAENVATAGVLLEAAVGRILRSQCDGSGDGLMSQQGAGFGEDGGVQAWDEDDELTADEMGQRDAHEGEFEDSDMSAAQSRNHSLSWGITISNFMLWTVVEIWRCLVALVFLFYSVYQRTISGNNNHQNTKAGGM